MARRDAYGRGRWVLIQVHVNAPAGFGGVGPLSELASERKAPGVIEAAVHGVLEAEGVHSGEVSVTFLDDTAMAELHERFLGVAAPTDVLSFGLDDSPEAPLADIYVGYQTGAAQAAELGVDVIEEWVRLAVHGLLHALGYDHPADDKRESSPMYVRQEELVRRFFEGTEGP